MATLANALVTLCQLNQTIIIFIISLLFLLLLLLLKPAAQAKVGKAKLLTQPHEHLRQKKTKKLKNKLREATNDWLLP